MMRSEPISLSPEMLDAIRQVSQEITVHSDQFETSLIQAQQISASRQNLGAALEKLTLSHLPASHAAVAAKPSQKKSAVAPTQQQQQQQQQQQPESAKSGESPVNRRDLRASSVASPQTPKKDPQASLLNALMEAGKRYRSSRLIKADRISDEELSRIRTEDNSIPDALREELWNQP